MHKLNFNSMLNLIWFFQESVANIDFSKHVDIEKNRFVAATVQIENATDFTSNITIKGEPGFRFDINERLDRLLDIKMFKPRSFGLICTENDIKHLKRKHLIYEYGNRTADDFVAHYQSELVTAKNEVPIFSFDFHDSLVNINYVALTVDVSDLNQWSMFELRTKYSELDFPCSPFRKKWTHNLV